MSKPTCFWCGAEKKIQTGQCWKCGRFPHENHLAPFVVLEGIHYGNRFYTTNSRDPEKNYKGKTVYKILGYAWTSNEALKIMATTK